MDGIPSRRFCRMRGRGGNSRRLLPGLISESPTATASLTVFIGPAQHSTHAERHASTAPHQTI